MLPLQFKKNLKKKRIQAELGIMSIQRIWSFAKVDTSLAVTQGRVTGGGGRERRRARAGQPIGQPDGRPPRRAGR